MHSVRALLIVLVTLLASCAEHYIPNTDVEDTEENRKLISFCEQYRRAVERRDVMALLKMISPDYYEDGGNADASDDMDYAQFKDWLTGASSGETGLAFGDATAIRHEIRYRRVLKENDRIFVDYTYSASYRIPTANGDEWKRKVDDNRIELVEGADGELKIVAGM
jgi:hypothetical protein